ncbi:MAG: hypothetical protein WAT39_09315 [Planctomycetota bacterium]
MLTCLVGALASATASAQVQLTNVPSLCQGFGSYDVGRDRVVELGVGITRLFDGVAWQVIPTPSMPVYGDWLAYDAARRVVVCVDQFNQTTWEWNGAVWAAVGAAAYAPSPTSFFYGHIAYHAGLRRVVMLALSSSTGQLAELREWLGGTWSALPASSIVVRPDPFRQYTYHAMAYDQARGRIVLFGRTERLNAGTFVASVPLTWEWEPQTGWVQFPAIGPLAPSQAMWFDEFRGKVLRFNTGIPVASVSIRTPSGGWTSVYASQPSGFAGPSVVYDSRRNRVYSQWGSNGGYFTDLYPASYDLHGTGCSTPSAPTLSLTKKWTRAWIGESLSVDVGQAPQGIAALATGVSDQAFGAVPLPLDLTAAGMPGCWLRTSLDAVLVGYDPDRVVTFQMPIPQSLSLLGMAFWQQGFVLSPAANAAGIAATDSMVARIGC